MSLRITNTTITTTMGRAILHSFDDDSSGNSIRIGLDPDGDRRSIEDKALIFFLIVLGTMAICGCSWLYICLTHNPEERHNPEQRRVYHVSVNGPLSPLPSGMCSIMQNNIKLSPGCCVLISEGAQPGQLSGRLYGDAKCLKLDKDPVTRSDVKHRIKIVDPDENPAPQVVGRMQSIPQGQYTPVTLYGLDSGPSEPVLLVLSDQQGYVCQVSDTVDVPQGSTVFKVEFVLPDLGTEGSVVSV